MRKTLTLAFALFFGCLPMQANAQEASKMDMADVQKGLAIISPNTPSLPINIPSSVRNGTWLAPAANYTYFTGPDSGNSVPIYSQGLTRCTTVKDALFYESCLNVDFLNRTGATPPWKANTAYTEGKFVQIQGGKVFKATKSGTSATTAPDWAKSGRISDGSVIWTYQSDGQSTAKTGMTLSSVSTAEGGNHWLINPNCVIQKGFQSQLYCIELDVGNYSGFDWTPTAGFPGPQALWIGGVTRNTGAAAINVGSQNSVAGKPAWYFGMWCGNALAAGQTCFEDWSNSTAGFHTASFANKTNDIWLQSTSKNGLYLNGKYSDSQIRGNGFLITPSGDITSSGSIISTGGRISANGDMGRVNLLTVKNAGWRAINTSADSKIGDLVIQGTRDGFSASFIDALRLGADGTIQLAKLTAATLPICNKEAAGKIAVISDGKQSPSYLQPVGEEGGASVRKVFCDGAGWVYN